MRSLAVACLPLACLTALAACDRPPPPVPAPTIERLDRREPAAAPLPSPETDGAVWAMAGDALLFGVPGQPPLVSLACAPGGAGAVAVTRVARADAEAEALVPARRQRLRRARADGRGVERRGWLWRGLLPADHPALDALEGRGPSP